MSRVITFTIAGVPVAKGRPRMTTRGKHPHAYTPAKTRAAEETLAARAMMYRPAQPLAGPLRLEVQFILPIPASWSKKKRQTASAAHTVKPDLDNLVKLLKDALNGIFWLDDKQVYDMRAVKYYGAIPQTVISITAREIETSKERASS